MGETLEIICPYLLFSKWRNWGTERPRDSLKVKHGEGSSDITQVSLSSLKLIPWQSYTFPCPLLFSASVVPMIKIIYKFSNSGNLFLPSDGVCIFRSFLWFETIKASSATNMQLNLKFTVRCFCFSFFTISHLVRILSKLVSFQRIYFLWWYIVLVENFIYWLCPLLNLLLVREHDKRISSMLLHLSYIVLDTQISHIQFCIRHRVEVPNSQGEKKKDLQIKCRFMMYKCILLIKINHSLY